jgi:hypothetical protein
MTNSLITPRFNTSAIRTHKPPGKWLPLNTNNQYYIFMEATFLKEQQWTLSTLNLVINT